jgi:hypothetical protein
MSKDLKFSDIKDEITGMVEETLKKNLEGKTYDQKEAQSTINQIVDDVIKNLHSNHKEFKFVVNGTLFQKGDSSLHYSSTCLWNPNTDGSTSGKYENDTSHAFVNVFGIVP